MVEPLVAQLRWPVRARLCHREDSARAWLDWRSCRHQGPALQGLEVLGRSVLLLSSPLPALFECTNVLLHLFFYHFEINPYQKIRYCPSGLIRIRYSECMKSSRTEAPTGRFKLCFHMDLSSCVGVVLGGLLVWGSFCFVLEMRLVFVAATSYPGTCAWCR